MIPALLRFVEELRREGIRVSPAEILDATRAVEAIDLADRSRFRGALRATLQKSARHRDAFERAFERFFATPRRGSRGKNGAAPTGGGERPGRGGEGAASTSRRPPPPPSDRAPKRSPQPATSAREPLRKLVESARDRRKVGRLRVVRLERAGRSETEKKEERARDVSVPPVDPARREISRPMSPDEEAELARLVPKIVDELRLRRSRRHERARQGRLDTRRLFRENLAHGGIPFVLPFRRPRSRRARVVLLVDVSYSVARSAGLFLRMAAEFLRIGRSARVVAFVDRPVDATGAIAKWLSRRAASGAPPEQRPARRGRRRPGEGIRVSGVSFADVLDGLNDLNLEAPSDYGRALHGLVDSRLRPSGRDTVLVILGDARTNRFDPLPWTLEEISRRCRFVLWLVSEPESRWGTGDSALAGYLPWVDVAVEAHDLAGLAHGLGELVRKI
jgi:uncharacterized protein with von Willebrand factor type A (vWA) domain